MSTSRSTDGGRPGRSSRGDSGAGWCESIMRPTGTAPNSEAMQTALGLCEARAHFDGPEREVYTRVGGANGKIYIDLANMHWQAIEITSTGWTVIDSKQVPIRFRRAAGMLA